MTGRSGKGGDPAVRTRRSRDTVKYYGKVARNLREAVEGRGETWTADTALEELARRDISKASQTAYISSLRFAESDNVKFLERLADGVDDLPKRDRRRRCARRVVSQGILERVVTEIRAKPSTTVPGLNDHVANMIVATRLYGLRPSEWMAAEWADADRTVLRVQNAKFARLDMNSGPFQGKTWKRANGKAREFLIPTRNRDVYQAAAQAVIDGVRKFSWRRYDRAMRRIHDEAVEKVRATGTINSIDAKSLTIYSYRHSFAADAKFSLDLFAGEVAALMGHISVATATRSYARRRSAKSIVGLRPSVESLAAVENRSIDRAQVLLVEDGPDFGEVIDVPVRDASADNEMTARNSGPSDADNDR